MIKTLLIDKTAVLKKYQQKCVELARYEDIDLTLLAPRTWVENYQKISLEKIRSANYRTICGRVAFKGYENRGFYYDLSLPRAIVKIEPRVIIMLEEPFSLFAFQTVFFARLFARNSKIIFYSSDDLSKDHRYPYRPSWVYRLISTFTLKNSHYAIVVNKTAKETLICKGFKSDRITIIPWGIDRTCFKPLNRKRIRSELNISTYTIGYVGRILKLKGIQTLLEAVASMQQKNAQLLIIGEGPDKQFFEQLAQEMGIHNRTSFMGYIEPDKLAKYYNAMDVLVLPTLSHQKWKEHFGRVLIEAMACGTPVIGSTCGGIPEVIGDSGLIFEEGNADSLKTKIEAILNSQSLREKLINKAMDRVEKNYTWEAFARKLHDIVVKVVKE